MRLRLFLISLALSSAACTDVATLEDELVTVSEPGGQPTPPQPPEVNALAARTITESTDAFEFRYSWPESAASIPALASQLEARSIEARAEFERAAQAEMTDAAKNDFPYRQHTLGVEWKTVAQLDDWLSLSADISTYTGGAHPNYGFASLIWNKDSDTAHEPLDLFRSATALDNAVGDRFCTELNEQRSGKRGHTVEVASNDMFDTCPSVSELTVLLGSSTGGKFDRIGLLAAPYVAGSYAEGSYEITVPVTTAVLDAVKPEYAGAFALGPRILRR